MIVKKKNIVIAGILLVICVVCFSCIIFLGKCSLLKDVDARVGDPGAVIDLGLLDRSFPDMTEWSKAGVEGGIPLRADVPIRIIINPGDDVQKAIDEAAQKQYGVVLLSPGRYVINKNIEMRSGVVLRGMDPNKCIIEISLLSEKRWDWTTYGIVMRKCQWAGIEDLTIIHAAVADIPLKTYRGIYSNDTQDIRNLHVGHVTVVNSLNCWVDNCRLFFSGTNPIQIWNSKHITNRNNVILESFNKGGKLNGYYLIEGSSYVLCCNEIISGIRHLSIQGGSKFNVVLNCYLEVDINFHGRDGGHNLVEGCLIALPKYHIWSPVASYRTPRGEGNILYNVETFDKRGGKNYIYYRDDNKKTNIPVVYEKNTVFGISVQDPPLVYRMDINPPTHQTLFPISGRCVSANTLREQLNSENGIRSSATLANIR